MWISIVVPLAVLLAALLLERLEAALLTAPDPAEHPTGSAVPSLTLVPPPVDPPAPRHPAPYRSTARATA